MNPSPVRIQSQLALAVALFLLLIPTCFAESSGAVTFRKAEYSIDRSAAIVPADESNSVRWVYPVMIGTKSARFERLNAWLRERSVEVFAECMPPPADELLKLTDKKLVNFLGNSPDFVACEVSQSVIEPAEALGRYIIFRRFSERQGLARPQHGIELLVFDLQSSKEIGIASLFKEDALETLNEALAEVIQRTRPNCSGRSFRWSQVLLHSPNHVFIEFPYNPAEWAACGDGVEALSGQAVSSQLRNPATLRPTRLLVEAK